MTGSTTARATDVTAHTPMMAHYRRVTFSPL